MFPVVGDTASGRAIESLRPERVDSPDDLVGRGRARAVGQARDARGCRRAGDRRPGALGCDQRLAGDDRAYPPEAEDRLGDFAALVAQAIANAAAQAEVRASRARLVATADAERKKLERNLHDGAQQRLVSISISLRLAQAKLQSAPADAGALIGGAAEELALALVELRELARGIHPAVLTDRGLAPALGALADRAPLPVLIESELDERLPSVVEAAAYYVVAESLTNVAKYARRELGQRPHPALERQRARRGARRRGRRRRPDARLGAAWPCRPGRGAERAPRRRERARRRHACLG